MEGLKVRRLPVINKGKRMVGILSLGDVSHSAPGDQGSRPASAGGARLSGRMKDNYVSASDDLARMKRNDDAAIVRLVSNSDTPSRAPYEELGFLDLRLDRDVLVHFSNVHRDVNRA
jgi:hypothetical protein